MSARTLLLSSAFVAIATVTAFASPPNPTNPASSPTTQPSPEQIAAGKAAFVDVARVLQSPRCQNCHPAGDAPLQTDRGIPHAQNVKRLSADAGLACTTCHQERNSEYVGVAGGPPGAHDWKLPPDDMPMIFEHRSVHDLCEQLKNPDMNGHKDFAALVHHVEVEPLVLWGWAPGGKRTLPPLTHDQFVAAFNTWIASNGACP